MGVVTLVTYNNVVTCPLSMQSLKVVTAMLP